jgi:hypothetical protein
MLEKLREARRQKQAQVYHQLIVQARECSSEEYDEVRECLSSSSISSFDFELEQLNTAEIFYKKFGKRKDAEDWIDIENETNGETEASKASGCIIC